MPNLTSTARAALLLPIAATVVVFNYGGDVYAPSPDQTEGDLKAGESFQTCTLFLVDPAHKAARVSFLPHVPGKDADFQYWAIP